jgi:hypothetical protein
MANNDGDSMFGLNFMLNKAVAMNIRILLQYAPPNAGIRLAGESFHSDSGPNDVPTPTGLSTGTYMLVPDNETFDLDNEDTWPDWAWGLSTEQVRVIAATNSDPRKRHLHADGQRALNDMNRRSNLPGYDPSRIRIPTYVSPTDRAEAGALVTETQPEALSKAERKRRQRVPVPLDAESDVGPVNFTDVTDEDVSHFRPVDVAKRTRGAAGSRGIIKRFRGRPLDR